MQDSERLKRFEDDKRFVLDFEDESKADREWFHPPAEFYFDRNEAARAIDFFPIYLRHILGELADTPIYLERWQCKITREIFGWKRKSDDTRQYREAFIEIPRKNSKSTMAAGWALYLLHCDREPGAEIYSAAADRDQASIVFDLASEMTKRARGLRRRTQIFKMSMVVWETFSRYRVISSDATRKHGFNAHAAIVDEVHAQPNRKLFDVLKTSMRARRQPLMIGITTAGDDPRSLAAEKVNYSRQILEKSLPVRDFYACIYEAPAESAENGDWRNESTWRLANPNYGISVKPEAIKAEAKDAEDNPSALNTFLQLTLNIWTTQAKRWMPPHLWKKCESSFKPEDLAGRVCYGGLDLSSRIDLASLALYFPPVRGENDSEKKPAHVLAYFWCPEDTIRERSEKDKVPYEVWRRQGLLEATPGNVIDYAWIRRRLNDLSKTFKIREVGFDPWGATQLTIELQDDGFKMVEIRQGFQSLSSATKELFALVKSSCILHNGNPVLSWNMSNVAIRKDPAGNEKPDKEKAREKIDGAVALIMALSRAMLQKTKKSAYEDRGVRVI